MREMHERINLAVVCGLLWGSGQPEVGKMNVHMCVCVCVCVCVNLAVSGLVVMLEILIMACELQGKWAQ